MKIYDIIIEKRKTIFWSVLTIILGGLAVFAFISILDPPFRSARNAKIKADISQIEKIAQEIYEEEGSYNNVNCSLEKIKPLCDDIKNISGLEPVIYVSQDKYCFFARFPVVNKGKGKYLCKDSTKNNYFGSSNYCNSETLTCSSQAQGPLIKAYQDYERKILFKDIIFNILKILIIGAFIFSWVMLFRKNKIIAVLIIIFLFVFLSMILSSLAGV